ncbi:MAG: hypothetical protein WDW36_008504 [Sanguina aurantia]
MSLPLGEAKSLVAELCRLFYDQGWVSGTGGGISIRASTDEIVMAPSGVQKERMDAEDMFVLNAAGEVVHTPVAKPAPNRPPKLSECSPLFMAAYELRNAGGVIHSHSPNAVMATMINPASNEFVVTHLEMIKGLEGHGFYGKMVIPIVENTARECELTDRLRQAIHDYPNTHAVLVRRHGVYIWGKDWIQAKTQAECYDYLFGMAVSMHNMGIDPSRPPAPIIAGSELPDGAPEHTPNGSGASPAAAGAPPPAAKRQRKASGYGKGMGSGAHLPTAVVLDIEGTVAPTSYVADVMFPYAAKHVRGFLQSTYESPATQQDLASIRAQAAEDVTAALPGSSPIPDGTPSGRDAVVDAAVAWVERAIAADRKVGALKTLQGHIWELGFKRGELKSELFRDVPDALVEWRASGLKTYVYSSGSRLAQRLFFGYSQVGDLRPYLCGFYDTSSGHKTASSSYTDIALSLGVDSNSEILFATDILAEAQAAIAAGWKAVLVERPGNKPLAAGHGIRVITSLQDLLQ